jgi:hypothetical protein
MKENMEHFGISRDYVYFDMGSSKLFIYLFIYFQTCVEAAPCTVYGIWNWVVCCKNYNSMWLDPCPQSGALFALFLTLLGRPLGSQVHRKGSPSLVKSLGPTDAHLLFCHSFKLRSKGFVLSMLWCSQTGDHPQEDLAKFGYTSDMIFFFLNLRILYCILAPCWNLL